MFALCRLCAGGIVWGPETFLQGNDDKISEVGRFTSIAFFGQRLL